MQIKREIFSREELYELVWSQPMVKLATRFAMSDVALKKICRKHNIPAPPRGYWRRVECGKVGKKIALPNVKNAPGIVIQVKMETKPMDIDFLSEDEKALIEAEATPEMAIEVSDALERAHAVTKATQRSLKAARVDEYGAIKCNSEEAFYIRIAPGSTERVLLIIDALMKACEKRGYSVRPGDPPRPNERRSATHAKLIIDGETIGLSIEETVRRRPHKLTDEELAEQARASRSRSWNLRMRFDIPVYDFIPSDILTLKIDQQYGSGLRHTWKDTARRRIETQLNDVMRSFIISAAWQRQRRLKEQERERRHKAELARREGLRQQLDREQKAVGKLEKDAELWRRAQVIRGFAEVVEARIKNGERTVLSQEPEAWLVWARDYADRIDPLTESKPSILDLDENSVRPLSIWEFERD